MKYSELMAQADKEKQRAKENLEVTKAELDGEIRQHYKVANEKITEKKLESDVLKSKRYREAMSNYIDAKYEYDILNSAVKAFDQRRSALENLAKLYLGNYYSKPKDVKRDEDESDPMSFEEKALQKGSESQRQELNRRMSHR